MPSDHAIISYVKSGIRIVGYSFLFLVDHHPSIWIVGAFLIIAEIIGIIEEIGY